MTDDAMTELLAAVEEHHLMKRRGDWCQANREKVRSRAEAYGRAVALDQLNTIRAVMCHNSVGQPRCSELFNAAANMCSNCERFTLMIHALKDAQKKAR